MKIRRWERSRYIRTDGRTNRQTWRNFSQFCQRTQKVWFLASAVKYMRNALSLSLSLSLSGQFRNNLSVKNPKIPLKMGYTETSVRNHNYSPCTSPYERSSCLYLCHIWSTKPNHRHSSSSYTGSTHHSAKTDLHSPVLKPAHFYMSEAREDFTRRPIRNGYRQIFTVSKGRRCDVITMTIIVRKVFSCN